jgi:RNA polymerase sigma factor (sigma-70 family)
LQAVSEDVSGTPPRDRLVTLPPLRGDEADLFRRHHRALVRAVAAKVNASGELIEDACQSAWLVLLGSQPDRTPALFAWLRTVAVHEAYHLSRQEWRDARLEELGGDQGWEEFVGSSRALDDAIEARRALATLAVLPVLQREDLALLIGGYSYREIAERAGAGVRSVNNVNKRLTKARARIRRLEAAA